MNPNPLRAVRLIIIRTISAEIDIGHMSYMDNTTFFRHLARFLGAPLIATGIWPNVVSVRAAGAPSGPLTSVNLYRDPVTNRLRMTWGVDNDFVPKPPIAPKEFCEVDGAGSYGWFHKDAQTLLGQIFPDAEFQVELDEWDEQHRQRQANRT